MADRLRSAHQLGDGDSTVVLVHGLEDTWRSWTRVAAELGAIAPGSRYRPMALDLPWRAGNDYGWRAAGTPGRWLAGALAELAHPVSAVVAHSFGANAVLELLGAGVAFDRVVLLAPVYQPRDRAVDDALRAEARRNLESAVRAGLRLRLRARALAPDLVSDMEGRLVRRVVPMAFPPFFDHVVHTNALNLSTVDIPTLVLGGTEDASLPPAGARSLAEAMPAARVHLRARYTHFCHLEQADLVAAELAEFLSTPTTTVGGSSVVDRHPRGESVDHVAHGGADRVPGRLAACRRPRGAGVPGP